MSSKIDNPIGPTEDQLLAFARTVLAVERQGSEDLSEPPKQPAVRIASLADLKHSGRPRDAGSAEAEGKNGPKPRTALFCIND